MSFSALVLIHYLKMNSLNTLHSSFVRKESQEGICWVNYFLNIWPFCLAESCERLSSTFMNDTGPLSIFLFLQNPTRLLPEDLRYAAMCSRDNPWYQFHGSRMLCKGHTAWSYKSDCGVNRVCISPQDFPKSWVMTSLRLYILKSVWLVC